MMIRCYEPKGALQDLRVTAFTLSVWLVILSGCATPGNSPGSARSLVRVSLAVRTVAVDTMIYGEMLEDCNDSIVYGGVVNADGSPRPAVDALIKPLDIPVVRWPGGTYSLEYHWENAVGPLDSRPVTDDFAWKGKDNNRFGTDEFLAWCEKVGTLAYINFNTGNQPPYGGTLTEAMNWIQYVNGSSETPYGRKRAANGHPEPYQVMYWGIGNENYGPWGRHDAESDTAYGDKLFTWASAIRREYPQLKLLAAGHTFKWDSTVLAKCGGLIDLLTQHYYVHSRVREGRLENPERSLFAPSKMEAHLERLKPLVAEINNRFRRSRNPLTLSIDEWDNRHNVYDSGKYHFSRQDPRYQFDVAVVAGMLNVFIRQSPLVGMANYIFPVNGHGLIRSLGDTGAFRASIYYVFDQYRRWMTGNMLPVAVTGPGIHPADSSFYLDGDASEVKMDSTKLTFIDASSVQGPDGAITVAVVNRNPVNREQVDIEVPEGYQATRVWSLQSPEITAFNSATDRKKVIPRETSLKPYRGVLSRTLSPCGVQLIRFEKKG